MAQVLEFKLPDLGEGLTEAEIVRWLVQVGDVVAVDQPVVEVETAKAMVEVPCPYGGVVTARFGEEGAELPVGAPLLTVAVGEGAEGHRPAADPGTDGGAARAGEQPGAGSGGPRARATSWSGTAPRRHPPVGAGCVRRGARPGRRPGRGRPVRGRRARGRPVRGCPGGPTAGCVPPSRWTDRFR